MSGFTSEEKEEFVREIDLKPFFDEIRKRMKINDISFKSEIKHDRFGAPYISFVSDNIADKCGVLSVIMKEVYINNFSSQVSDKEGKLSYYLTASFDWTFNDDGMNGHTLLRGYYENGYWTFFQD